MSRPLPDFVARHVGPNRAEVATMLQAIGADSLTALIDETVPTGIRASAPLTLEAAGSEHEALNMLDAHLEQNQIMKSLIGLGYQAAIMPPVIQRNLLENPAWYTAYTPYQAEISQGRLEMLLSFQQLVMDLTGLDVANASLLDEATACAEAMTMAQRTSRSKSPRILIDSRLAPQNRAVVKTRAMPLGIEVVEQELSPESADEDCFAILLAYPGCNGEIIDIEPIIRAANARKVVAIVCADPLMLSLLKPPGEMGADIVVGSTQRFGLPLGFGGPHAAYMACHSAHKRSLPGRLIGLSRDSRDRPALRMALQTREQHIRRDKATSNICTAQALPAMLAAAWVIYHGADGVKAIAEGIHQRTNALASAIGRERVANADWFDTLTIRCEATAVVKNAATAGYNLRVVDEQHVAIALDETIEDSDVDSLVALLDGSSDESLHGFNDSQRRESSIFSARVFNDYRSETAMMRYLARLANRDLALDRTMIPLGSCTMKLNAAVEMMPISDDRLMALHPFAPADQVEGYRAMIGELETMLATITGFDDVSFQPNSGSQGEYAGLQAIRGYHAARGEGHRHICLIPASAHGTNPASAVLAGMKVVVVDTDSRGNIDVSDLAAKAEKHSDHLAALMVTYPSTHGVFEEAIREITDIAHQHGGQVYLDGANLNAMVGLCRPGDFGADVSHINLHKTFCIPHGGGGPGMGPIGIKAHLAPFLPGHPLADVGHGTPQTVVSSAPWGSASILAISWMYIRLMGGAGLTHATEVAILSANYLATRLGEHYPVLYRGQHGRVAHECILDCRDFRHHAGVSVEDIAKRLIDYGFHAPTVSFPVADTLMIEPTESENLDEMDRLIQALVAIRGEIQAITDGQIDYEHSPLANAPHTADMLLGDWDRKYTRSEAVAPTGDDGIDDKFWPPVGRVDNVFGDRNVICSCLPLDAYRDSQHSNEEATA
ncbi:aminomethyl-transferring glycine dehydrogenase [Gammaproteobacteria bacterium]|nr:aminomethyl-transferring glycine dehydrogenase [Gammaproteobacteria bacterium]